MLLHLFLRIEGFLVGVLSFISLLDACQLVEAWLETDMRMEGCYYVSIYSIYSPQYIDANKVVKPFILGEKVYLWYTRIEMVEIVQNYFHTYTIEKFKPPKCMCNSLSKT